MKIDYIYLSHLYVELGKNGNNICNSQKQKKNQQE